MLSKRLNGNFGIEIDCESVGVECHVGSLVAKFRSTVDQYIRCRWRFLGLWKRAVNYEMGMEVLTMMSVIYLSLKGMLGSWGRS